MCFLASLEQWLVEAVQCNYFVFLFYFPNKFMVDPNHPKPLTPSTPTPRQAKNSPRGQVRGFFGVFHLLFQEVHKQTLRNFQSFKRDLEQLCFGRRDPNRELRSSVKRGRPVGVPWEGFSEAT